MSAGKSSPSRAKTYCARHANNNGAITSAAHKPAKAASGT